MKDLKNVNDEIGSVSAELLEIINKIIAIIKKINDLRSNNRIELTETHVDEIKRNFFRYNEFYRFNIPVDFLDKIFSAVFEPVRFNSRKINENELLVKCVHTEHFKSLNEIFNIHSGLPTIIAGPCAVECSEYMKEVAVALKNHNIRFLRGGAYKPRTSPYDFQGLKEDGLKILQEVCEKYNLISVSEVMDTRDVELVRKYVHVLQIGARNMHNYELLKEVGQTRHPVILKRGMSASVEEFIYAGEYMALQGNRTIILCERGIRTFETNTRNTLDISSIPIIKNETCLPIIVDLSHSLGRKDIICPIAKSVLAAGADGIMLEVHPKPEFALSDSKQQLDIEEFGRLLADLGLGKK
jgi:3-deoxy-7-phosphoheptulonate synthase/chorismate mutase